MRRALILFVAVLACSSVGVGQERARRQATVVTIDDKKYEGIFVKADEAGVTIEAGDVQTTIKLDTVKMITFGAAAASAPPTPTSDLENVKEVEAAQRAIKALRRLANAAQVGVSYVNYTPMVVEAKTEVEDALGSIKNPHLVAFLGNALLEYRYAAVVWQRTWRDTNIHDKDLKRIATTDYEVRTHGLLRVVWRDEFLAAIWARAQQNLERAAKIAEEQ